MTTYGFVVKEIIRTNYTVEADSQQEAENIFAKFYEERPEIIGEDLGESWNTDFEYEPTKYVCGDAPVIKDETYYTYHLASSGFAWFVDEAGEDIRMYKYGELVSDNFLAENALVEEYEKIWKKEVEPLYVSNEARYNIQEQAKQWEN